MELSDSADHPFSANSIVLTTVENSVPSDPYPPLLIPCLPSRMDSAGTAPETTPNTLLSMLGHAPALLLACTSCHGQEADSPTYRLKSATSPLKTLRLVSRAGRLVASRAITLGELVLDGVTIHQPFITKVSELLAGSCLRYFSVRLLANEPSQSGENLTVAHEGVSRSMGLARQTVSAEMHQTVPLLGRLMLCLSEAQLWKPSLHIPYIPLTYQLAPIPCHLQDHDHRGLPVFVAKVMILVFVKDSVLTHFMGQIQNPRIWQPQCIAQGMEVELDGT